MDPYRTLGISPDASDEEVKRAYRTLMKKYHPDANINNPDKAGAERRFQEVQEAYETIIRSREQGGFSAGGYSYSNRDQSTDTDTENVLKAASNYIRNGYYREAMTALSGTAEPLRNAAWYYLAALSSAGLGNQADARLYADRAVQLEPGNFTYRQLKSRLDGAGFYGSSGAGDWYETRGSRYGQPYDSMRGSWCLDLAMMNLCCFCC